MNESNNHLFDLPIAGLAFQEEIMDDVEHRFSYRYKRRVHIKVCISTTDNGISLSLTSNKKNRKTKKLLNTIETHLMERITEHPRYRMYLVTGNKPVETDIDFNVEENVYLSMVEYHYGLWGQWVSLLLVIGIAFLNLTLGKWIGGALFGCSVVYFSRCMFKLFVDESQDPKTRDGMKNGIIATGICTTIAWIAFVVIRLFEDGIYSL